MNRSFITGAGILLIAAYSWQLWSVTDKDIVRNYVLSAEHGQQKIYLVPFLNQNVFSIKAYKSYITSIIITTIIITKVLFITWESSLSYATRGTFYIGDW